MYNLLIVDDELTIRNGLIHTIDWKALGISVAGDVRHGRITSYNVCYTKLLRLQKWKKQGQTFS